MICAVISASTKSLLQPRLRADSSLPRCASAIKIVRPLESTAATQPQTPTVLAEIVSDDFPVLHVGPICATLRPVNFPLPYGQLRIGIRNNGDVIRLARRLRPRAPESARRSVFRRLQRVVAESFVLLN